MAKTKEAAKLTPQKKMVHAAAFGNHRAKTPDPKQKDQVFTLKQNYTILVKAEELGKDTGARIVFAGGKSGTQGLMTLAARPTTALGFPDSAPLPGKATIAEFQLYQPGAPGNPEKEKAAFVATIMGGDAKLRRAAVDILLTKLLKDCFLEIDLTVPASPKGNSYRLRSKLAASGQRVLIKRSGAGWKGDGFAVDAINFIVNGQK